MRASASSPGPRSSKCDRADLKQYLVVDRKRMLHIRYAEAGNLLFGATEDADHSAGNAKPVHRGTSVRADGFEGFRHKAAECRALDFCT
jgi:hypothetical protein